MPPLFFSVSNTFFIKISSDTNIPFTESEYLLLKGYIPGVTKLDGEPERIDFIVEHTESEDKRFVQAKDNVQIFDKWDGRFSADLYNLLYGIARLQFLDRDLFPIHAACVGKDEFVLIIGHSGAGKTSVSLNLLQRDDMKMFSGNKTVVAFGANNSLIARAGTPTITIRGNDKSKLNDLKISDHIEYWDRYAFMLSRDKYTNETSVRIKAIAIVRLNDYSQENKKINPMSALHSLYPFFLDAVNADIVIGNTDDVFLGTPSDETRRYLVAHLKNALENTPVYSLIGSATFVADEISRL